MRKVLVLGKIREAGLERLRAAGQFDVVERPDNPPDLHNVAHDIWAIIVRTTPINRALLQHAPALRIVARHGVGYDAVDVPALTERGIPLAVTGDVNSVPVAEHTLALMLDLAKHVTAYDHAIREDRFSIRDRFAATEFAGRTVLLIGFGRIGKRVARLCQAFDMRVIVTDPFVSADMANAASVDLATDATSALPLADYVSIHAPKIPGAKPLIGAAELALMKRGAMLINVSRGGMVDEQALLAALQSGHLGGAELDVFEKEPLPSSHPLATRPDVVLSPHSAAFTQEAGERMAVSERRKHHRLRERHNRHDTRRQSRSSRSQKGGAGMLNAAIIGLGGWGQRLVHSVHGKSDKIRIACGVTRTPAKAAEFSRETGIPLTSDYAAMLADPAIDAVIIATPHSQHVDQIVAAAGAAKQVFVEKPLALTRADVAEAFDACEKAGVLLAVGQNRRFLPAVREINRLIREDELGTILHMEANFSGPSGAHHATSSWRASAAESPWGGMTGKGLHMSDLMILFAGEIAEVDARSRRRILTADLDDVTVMLMAFAFGATATLATLTATADMFRLRVFGSKGWAELDGHNRLHLAFIGQEPRVIDFFAKDIERAELEAFAAAAGKSVYPVTRQQAENNIAFLEAIGRSVAASGPAPVERGETTQAHN